MNYNEALSFILNTKRFGKRASLEKNGKINGIIENPQDKLSFIHVAGTNGKGSTTSMIASGLKNAGFKVGLFVSPYITDFRERISINSEFIKEEELADILSFIMPFLDIILKEGFDEITHFELITAIAFLYFEKQNCDFVCLEVGLGGRFDATNIIKNPLVSVITSISYDHTDILGDTLSKIAFEKCGIIKDNSFTVSYPFQENEAFEVIFETCLDKNNILVCPGKKSFEIIRKDIDGSLFRYRDLEFFVPLSGEHMVYNAVTAIETLFLLKEKRNVSISEKSITKGIGETFIPGRMEIISKDPLIILDGAHNVSGIDALVSSLKTFAKDKKIITVMGILKDKSFNECILKISKISNTFISVPANSSSRALEEQEISKIAKCDNKHVYTCHSVEEAVKLAKSIWEENSLILFCGSLYLISQIRGLLKEKNNK